MEERYRKGVFFVVYAKKGKDVTYLLLKRKLHWNGWEFPKGGVEFKEKIGQTVRRELMEETGFKPINMSKFDVCGKYKYDKKYPERKNCIGQTFKLFAVEVKQGKPKLDRKEHSDYQWFDFEQAIKKLTWSNQRRCLTIVNDAITKQKIKKTNFRQSKTLSGKIILAGKDAQSNEDLIKQVKPNEFVFHTIAPGSPFVNIKAPSKEVSKKDLFDAAILCAKHSQDWRNSKKDILVHYFLGKDIYKKKDMKLGTFGVKNTKSLKVRKEEIK